MRAAPSQQENFMFHNIAIGTIAALTITSAAQALDIKSVDVTVELDAIENQEAAAYWTTIADDLETAIVAKILDRTSEDGAVLEIDLEEVSLSNTFSDQLGLADTRLTGMVRTIDTTGGGNSDAYELSVDVNSAIPLMPEGTDVTLLSVDSRVYYDSMIAAFAQAVVDRIE
jgi:hypothetical protein